MVALQQAFGSVRVAPFVTYQITEERMTKIVRLFGRLVAYAPRSRRAYYRWLLILTFRPQQRISYTQFSPAHMRIVLCGKWELGLILGSWFLGLKLGQPLAWVKRLQVA